MCGNELPLTAVKLSRQLFRQVDQVGSEMNGLGKEKEWNWAVIAQVD